MATGFPFASTNNQSSWPADAGAQRAILRGPMIALRPSFPPADSRRVTQGVDRVTFGAK